MTTETMKFKKSDKAAYKANKNFVVHIEVLDSRISYGREQYLIAPTQGAGNKWVDGAALGAKQ
jgi:hypothetical protein